MQIITYVVSIRTQQVITKLGDRDFPHFPIERFALPPGGDYDLGVSPGKNFEIDLPIWTIDDLSNEL